MQPFDEARLSVHWNWNSSQNGGCEVQTESYLNSIFLPDPGPWMLPRPIWSASRHAERSCDDSRSWHPCYSPRQWRSRHDKRSGYPGYDQRQPLPHCHKRPRQARYVSKWCPPRLIEYPEWVSCTRTRSCSACNPIIGAMKREYEMCVRSRHGLIYVGSVAIVGIRHTFSLKMFLGTLEQDMYMWPLFLEYQ